MTPPMLDDEPETDELSYASVAFGLKLPTPAGSINRSAGIWMEPWASERCDQLQQDWVQNPQAHSRITAVKRFH